MDYIEVLPLARSYFYGNSLRKSCSVSFNLLLASDIERLNDINAYSKQGYLIFNSALMPLY